MIDLYNEKIRDLLDKSKSDLRIWEDKINGIYIQDLTD